MIVHLFRNDSPQYEGAPPELYLEAQNDNERKMLALLEAGYKTIGCGRVGEGLRMHHVRVALVKREGSDE